MNVLFMVTALLPLAMAAGPDPTTFCAPRQFSYTTFFVLRKALFNVYSDFDKNLTAWVHPFGQTRSVYNTHTKMTYEIDSKYGVQCSSFKRDVTPYIRCLPADARYIGEYQEGFGSPSINLHAFEFNRNGLLYTFIMREDKGQGSYANIITSEHAKTKKQYSMLFNGNPRVGVADPHVFDIPSDCPLSQKPHADV